MSHGGSCYPKKTNISVHLNNELEFCPPSYKNKVGTCIIWVFPKLGIPKNGWFIMGTPIKKWRICGENPLFSETSIWKKYQKKQRQPRKIANSQGTKTDRIQVCQSTTFLAGRTIMVGTQKSKYTYTRLYMYLNIPEGAQCPNMLSVFFF